MLGWLAAKSELHDLDRDDHSTDCCHAVGQGVEIDTVHFTLLSRCSLPTVVERHTRIHTGLCVSGVAYKHDCDQRSAHHFLHVVDFSTIPRISRCLTFSFWIV